MWFNSFSSNPSCILLLGLLPQWRAGIGLPKVILSSLAPPETSQVIKSSQNWNVLCPRVLQPQEPPQAQTVSQTGPLMGKESVWRQTWPGSLQDPKSYTSYSWERKRKRKDKGGFSGLHLPRLQASFFF